MSVPTCCRRLQWCMGHRLYGHEGKCRHLHGHNYVGYFHARARALDNVGRVIDFSVIKERVGSWIETYWDHGFLYWDCDKELKEFFRFNDKNKSFPHPTNPTAENIALYLIHSVCPQVLEGAGVEIYRVLVWETENCFAEVEL